MCSVNHCKWLIQTCCTCCFHIFPFKVSTKYTAGSSFLNQGCDWGWVGVVGVVVMVGCINAFYEFKKFMITKSQQEEQQLYESSANRRVKRNKPTSSVYLVSINNSRRRFDLLFVSNSISYHFILRNLSLFENSHKGALI